MAYEPKLRIPALQGPPTGVVTADDRETFTIEVNNRDQFGRQRRMAIEAMAKALGATTYSSVKNENGTGNDAFVITVTGGRRRSWAKLDGWVFVVDNVMLSDVIAEARAAAKAVEGATANDVQKAWKLAARNFTVESGARRAESFAAATTDLELAFA